MKIQTLQRARAFTLVEMLVVIAIIAILASILLPVLSTIKTKAKIAQAKQEMANLETAIKAYESEYNRPPGYQGAERSSTTGLNHPDFTYGTDNTMTTGPRVQTGNSVETNNAVVMAVLLARTKLVDGTPTFNDGDARNPRKLSLFNVKEVDSPLRGGLGPDLVFRDPWGNPYIISIDMNDDNRVCDGFYRHLPTPSAGFSGTVGAWELPRSIMIWSFGPDGKADMTVGPKAGVNADNVKSWD